MFLTLLKKLKQSLRKISTEIPKSQNEHLVGLRKSVQTCKTKVLQMPSRPHVNLILTFVNWSQIDDKGEKQFLIKTKKLKNTKTETWSKILILWQLWNVRNWNFERNRIFERKKIKLVALRRKAKTILSWVSSWPHTSLTIGWWDWGTTSKPESSRESKGWASSESGEEASRQQKKSRG